jgi:hypothetical protein
MKGRREKDLFSRGGYRWEVCGHKERGMKVYMVGVF